MKIVGYDGEKEHKKWETLLLQSFPLEDINKGLY